MTAITMPIAVMMWAIFLILFVGLPDYYRQAPGKVPSFYKSLFRRKIITVRYIPLCSFFPPYHPLSFLYTSANNK